MKILFCILTVISVFTGRVIDQNGHGVAYATVYPEIAPEWGTATNNDGLFSFEANLTRDSRVIVSCIGYEKKTVMAEQLLNADTLGEPFVITINEQPIALQETVVAAKKSKQKNKRKQMAALLHSVYVKLEEEFPDDNAKYSIVSDVRMLSEEAAWGMEQMIADIVVLPEEGAEGKDSVQFHGVHCKRFFPANKRDQADSLLAGHTIERIEKKSPGTYKHKLRRAVNALDSGVVVHRALFAMGNMRYDFEQAMADTKHWTVSNESDGETVLTHTEKKNKYLGLFQQTFYRHYILDSETYAVRRFSEHAEVKITIPFGYKLNSDQLQMLNMLNMDDDKIKKFRLKKMYATIDYNTIYQRCNGYLYILEKNMYSNGRIIGSRDIEIPIFIKATQHVIDLKNNEVEALKKEEITTRIQRELVEIIEK